ncbi:MAG: electron transfer flavoprotein subunit beta [Gammaproteobacteria bacterium]|jgi:electron transfer flavoprotein beta subunit|nr:electron transfer flavoprotein subunit beta [Gammaproteobacteria bacterium]|tara:strand:- start:3706 stop:4458 length:753 start_codon:yes stop_codon:yes gene_type:complete
MKILVPIKRVNDYNVKVRPNQSNTDVDLTNVKMAVNPFCEIALEEAIRIKEAGNAEEVVAVSVGSEKNQEQLRTALALGADRAILIKTEVEVQPLDVAKILVKIFEKENPKLVLMGKQGIDGDHNQTGQMLGAMLSIPQATFASKVEINADSVNVTREIDGGLETLSVELPAIVTTDLRLNEPRYASLPNIMKAKRKPIDEINLEELGLSIEQKVKTVKVESPSEREEGIKVDSVDALLDKLRNEAKVIE